MKKLVIIAFILSAMTSYGQKNMGIGLRLGTLNGITFKKYSSATDLEISLGNSYTSYNMNYKNYFNDVYLYKKGFVVDDYKYKTHRAYNPMAVQVRLLFHKNLDKIGDESISGLKWYYGIGGQLGSRTVDFYYEYKGGPEEMVTYRDLDLGAEGIIGLEYLFENAPVSLFLDVSLFMELVDDPFFFWFQGGIGARYRF